MPYSLQNAYVDNYFIKLVFRKILFIWVTLTCFFSSTMKPTEFTKRFYRLKDVIRVTTLSRSTIYRYMYEGLFPKQIEIAPRIVVWLESDVQKWMSEKIEMHAS